MFWVQTQILIQTSKVCSGLRWVFQIAMAGLEALQKRKEPFCLKKAQMSLQEEWSNDCYLR